VVTDGGTRDATLGADAAARADGGIADAGGMDASNGAVDVGPIVGGYTGGSCGCRAHGSRVPLGALSILAAAMALTLGRRRRIF